MNTDKPIADMTAAEARARILTVIDNIGREDVLIEIVQWNNTVENDIDADGDIWVSNPQTGHWLDADRLIEFAAFLLR
jgi:hypothetical protein